MSILVFRFISVHIFLKTNCWHILGVLECNSMSRKYLSVDVGEHGYIQKAVFKGCCKRVYMHIIVYGELTYNSNGR